MAVPSPDLGALLREGPFDAALRAAIRARGLSLDRLREHLR
ncbi:XRE family transcriptional regulator, partial [Amycolatopsis sp. SID8362]|nr:XRE family transcriptional regulator [Amycolatopsis sp. SID8362]NED44043.1 XRE family transcriptional regulator [Amycolatopsis sp. SID8362]